MGLIIRNVGEYSGKFDVPMREINTMGEIGLSLFVSMALMTLELWELADLAIPMIVILLIQIIVLILFLIFIAFRLLGKNYDAAVMIRSEEHTSELQSRGHLVFRLLLEK